MKLSIFALIAPLCVYGHRGCGTPEFTPQELARNEMEFKAIVKTLPDSLDEFSTVIDVYFHEIRDEETSPLIDPSRITKQIDFMNNAFSNSGITFKHISTESVVNPLWSRVDYGGDAQTAMKTALRKGGKNSLNVFLTQITGTILGYATFPTSLAENPLDDGIVLNPIILTGGNIAGFDAGDILVHETGHWVGLYHTFQGGCFGSGDFVLDTPPSASPSSGCPTMRSSCGLANIYDPIHNYMDYSSNECMYEFTPNQIERMQLQLQSYRL